MYSKNNENYIKTQVIHLRRNEYDTQFGFFVEMTIKQRPFKVSQNDYYDQS